MVDSRVKGQRGEYLVRDLLRKHTGLKFERVPSSGALAYLKGDLYIPTAKNRFCIEVKNYEKSPFTDKIFTNKTNYILQWWAKVCEQADAFEQDPLLFFKYSRSKIFVMTHILPESARYTYVSWLNAYILLAEEWLEQEEIAFEI